MNFQQIEEQIESIGEELVSYIKETLSKHGNKPYKLLSSDDDDLAELPIILYFDSFSGEFIENSIFQIEKRGQLLFKTFVYNRDGDYPDDFLSDFKYFDLSELNIDQLFQIVKFMETHPFQ
jgi:hypothetical protein